MSKDADVRLNETMKQIMTLFPGNGRPLKDAIQNHLMRSFSHGPARVTLSDNLALGGFRPSDTKRRHLERIYLLAERTVLGKPATAIAALKTTANGQTEKQLEALISGIAATVALTPPAGTVQIAESFSYGASNCAQKATDAVVKARRILVDMYQGIKAAKSDPRERARFELWFGVMNEGRYETVRSNIEKIYTDVTTRPLKLYYRGSGVNGMPDDQPGISYHNIYVKLRADMDNYGAYIPGWPNGGAESDRTHILLGGAFFTSCQVTSHATDVTKMSGAGVIIHELSHAVCRTKDGKNSGGEVLYGPRKCKAAAIDTPDVAINNADNYRLFSDEYDGTSL